MLQVQFVCFFDVNDLPLFRPWSEEECGVFCGVFLLVGAARDLALTCADGGLCVI